MIPENPAHPFHRIPRRHARILLDIMPTHFQPAKRFCRQRVCRRIGACRGAVSGVGDSDTVPPCLVGLHFRTADARDDLLEVLSDVYWGHPRCRSGSDDRTRRMEDAAIAIMRAALPRMPGRLDAFSIWHEIYIAPPIDTAAFLVEAKAELARARQSLAAHDMIERARRRAAAHA